LLEVVWVQGVVGIAKTVLLLWYEGSGLGDWHSPSSIACGKHSCCVGGSKRGYGYLLLRGGKVVGHRSFRVELS